LEITTGDQSSSSNLTATPNPAYLGQIVTFTATVAGNPTSGTPTGSVTFSIDGVLSSPITLINGQAVFAISK
jgi:hypothetical protein